MSSSWIDPTTVVMTLEIRKDETPVWYLRSIIEKAKKEEIVLMTNSKMICRRGRISDIENLDSALDENIVVPLEARITPEKNSH